MEDKIIIKNLVLPARVGLYAEENSNEQKVVVDLEISIDLRKAGMKDSIYETVNFTTVRKEITALFAKKKFRLIEAAAEQIASQTLAHKHVRKVRVMIKKERFKEKPLIGIEITRERHD